MKIAIVEDDINMRKSLEIALGDYPEFEIVTFKNAKDALKKIDNTYNVVVTDINMPGMDGLAFIKELETTFAGIFEIIIMTGNATLQKAIDSIRMGVKDFLLKPFEIDTLVSAINRSAKIQQRTKTKPALDTAPTSGGFIGQSEAINRAKAMAFKAAKTDAAVMLLGESGVGKELFARYIHENSPRSEKPFIAINMAAIPENLIESELFGFMRGAFTDAHADKMGKFEQAHGGTLFLDEIAEMPFHLQAKLLRALQEREVVRLGAQKALKIDVRILSATNANVGALIRESQFREDLYYRLNTIPIAIPPLRERRDEIATIAQSILQATATRYDLGEKSFGSDAMEALMHYEWPGNIRELLSVVERAAILSDGSLIKAHELFLESRSSEKYR